MKEADPFPEPLAPHRGPVRRSWVRPVAAAAGLVLISLPWVISLGRPDVSYHMEALTLMSSRETWARSANDGLSAWWIPSWNGQPRLNKPPLVVWLHGLAWAGLDPATTPADVLTRRARAMAALFMAGTALCAAWAGRSLGGRGVALPSAVILTTMWLFQRQARLSSYDTYLLFFATLSMASALWAGTRSRGAAVGWALSGAAMGLAVLAKGPIAFVFTLGPLFALCATRPPRIIAFRGLAVAVALAATVALPWHLDMLRRFAQAASAMGAEYVAQRDRPQPPWYYLGLLGLMLPWSIGLIGTLVAAWKMRRSNDPPSGAGRRALLWAGVIFLLMSLHVSKQQRYILPILPPLALAIACALFTMLEGEGWIRRRRWRIAQRILMGTLSVGAAVFLLGHDFALRQGWLDHPALGGLPLLVRAPLAALILMLAYASDRAWRTGPWRRGVIATAASMALAVSVAQYGHIHTKSAGYRQRADVERVAALIGPAPLVYLRSETGPVRGEAPDAKMLYYAQRIIPGRTAEELRRPSAPVEYLMASDLPALDQIARDHGFSVVDRFSDGNTPRVLYVRKAMPTPR